MTESGRVSEMPSPDQIFHDLSDSVEDVNEYRPGGYYPIQLGQSLRNGRYLILRKLGYGSYSTVWLARDQT
jgi:serine/threonine-protein kinase SRPK3